MSRYLVIGFFVMLLFSGCYKKGFTQSEVGYLSSFYRGTVLQATFIKIEDDGLGFIQGAVLGGAAGYYLGGSGGYHIAGSTIAPASAAFGGAILGGLLASKLNEDNGQLLLIRLDDGREVAIVHRITNEMPKMFREGDSVVVVKTKNRDPQVELNSQGYLN